ncbi:MAG: biotin transporter BioY [Desulfobacterales bacterium]|nr:biotin transporter BioY [Desulfobacterales bacterium]
MKDVSQLQMMTYASLLAALTAVGAYIAVPIGPVPIVLQSLFILLSGLLLGSTWGVAGVGIYLLAGAFGLPVFAGGTGGIGRFIGPTGGYLLGFLPAVYVIGLISERKKQSVLIDIIAMLCGTIIIYTCGVSWLKVLTGMDLKKAVAVGMIPFLIGDALKIAAAVFIARSVRPVIGRSRI